MERIARRIQEEPILIAALILAALNVGWDVSAEQAATITTWVESGVVIIAGFLGRAKVTPIAKLKRKGMHT